MARAFGFARKGRARRMRARQVFEVTSIDTGKTFYWTRAKCERVFGRLEFREIEQGYAPHIVAIDVTGQHKANDAT